MVVVVAAVVVGVVVVVVVVVVVGVSLLGDPCYLLHFRKPTICVCPNPIAMTHAHGHLLPSLVSHLL